MSCWANVRFSGDSSWNHFMEPKLWKVCQKWPHSVWQSQANAAAVGWFTFSRSWELLGLQAEEKHDLSCFCGCSIMFCSLVTNMSQTWHGWTLLDVLKDGHHCFIVTWLQIFCEHACLTKQKPKVWICRFSGYCISIARPCDLEPTMQPVLVVAVDLIFEHLWISNSGTRCDTALAKTLVWICTPMIRTGQGRWTSVRLSLSMWGSNGLHISLSGWITVT